MSTEITRDLLIDTMQRAYTRRGDVTERARLGAQADAILTLLAEHDRQVAEQAWDEAVNASVLHYVPPSGLYSGVSWPANPYRADSAAPARRDRHPEDYCHRCGGPNVSWWVPSPVWNAVIGYPDQAHDGIVCPRCFAELAEAKGAKGPWRWAPREWPEGVSLVHMDGRVWDAAMERWIERAPTRPAPDEREVLVERGGLTGTEFVITAWHIEDGCVVADEKVTADEYVASRPVTRVCVCNVGAQECPVHPGRVRTKEEKIAFRKNWDAKVERQ